MEGTAFGRYRLLALLGRGGMGEIWRAFDSETNPVVAVKVLPVQLATDPAFSARSRREANAAAGLNNPHVIPIHHFGEIAGRLYVDMRLVDGHDLQQILQHGPLDPSRVGIVEQVASALHAAHRIGLVHRTSNPPTCSWTTRTSPTYRLRRRARHRSDQPDQHRQHRWHLGLHGSRTHHRRPAGPPLRRVCPRLPVA